MKSKGLLWLRVQSISYQHQVLDSPSVNGCSHLKKFFLKSGGGSISVPSVGPVCGTDCSRSWLLTLSLELMVVTCVSHDTGGPWPQLSHCTQWHLTPTIFWWHHVPRRPWPSGLHWWWLCSPYLPWPQLSHRRHDHMDPRLLADNDTWPKLF